MKLAFGLHPAQQEVFNNEARYKVVAAGRRFGKSHLAAVLCIIWALSEARGPVFYVAPTFQQGKDIVWKALLKLAAPLLANKQENIGVITLKNGNTIHVKGSDRPDTLRGVGLGGLVIDEYADMKPNTWDEILAPSCADFDAPVLFIGTPKGRNHFYQLAEKARLTARPDRWAYFHFTSFDNPFISRDIIESKRLDMPSWAFDQEFMASFEGNAAGLFDIAWFRERADEPEDGSYVVTADLCGFADVLDAGRTSAKNLDSTAIVTAKILPNGAWWVKDIVHGRWDVRETAVRLVKACRDVNVHQIGIEKGTAKNAVGPYLQDTMQRMRYNLRVEALTHGNKAKTDRILWGLQGRLEHGRVHFRPGEYLTVLRDQASQFPSAQAHDDLLDALAYVDQMARVSAHRFDSSDDDDAAPTWQPYDLMTGY